jgi:hypothetical protein
MQNSAFRAKPASSPSTVCQAENMSPGNNLVLLSLCAEVTKSAPVDNFRMARHRAVRNSNDDGNLWSDSFLYYFAELVLAPQ